MSYDQRAVDARLTDARAAFDAAVAADPIVSAYIALVTEHVAAHEEYLTTYGSRELNHGPRPPSPASFYSSLSETLQYSLDRLLDAARDRRLAEVRARRDAADHSGDAA
jgi:hypothetical protein